MGYFSDLDLRLRTAGIDPTMHVKDCPYCGGERQIVGFIPPNTLEVTCRNEQCKWHGTKQIVWAYPKLKDHSWKDHSKQHGAQVEETPAPEDHLLYRASHLTVLIRSPKTVR